jgi:hypothetical protein
MQFYGGGAFADCPYIQYPHGLGKQRAPAIVVTAAAAAAAAAAATGTARVSAIAAPSFASSARGLNPPSKVPATTISSSRAVALVSPAAAGVSLSVAVSPLLAQKPPAETAAETTARTAKGIQESLQAAQPSTEVFDGRLLALQSRERAAVNKPNTASKALSIVISDSEGVAGARENDPGPIVRSPTKEKKNPFTDALLLRTGSATTTASSGPSGAASTALVTGVSSSGVANDVGSSASRKVVVPFCVSSWQNRKKLIVPVEQRLAQQHDDRLDLDSGMGDAIVDLAVAMQQASKEVAAEMAAKEKARLEEEERRQAALEAAEAEKARQLLEQKAAELAANAQRRETREQRLERIRLERELREQEKLARQEQRLRERAAARLNITVEDLEADEQLLKTVEEASTQIGVSASAAGASRTGSATRLSSSVVKLEQQQSQYLSAVKEEEDDDEGATGGRRKPAVRGGVFASAVISNEGIQREMEALAAVEAQQQQQQQSTLPSHDGIRLRDEDENSADEDDDDGEGGGFQLQQFVKKKPRL